MYFCFANGFWFPQVDFASVCAHYVLNIPYLSTLATPTGGLYIVVCFFNRESCRRPNIKSPVVGESGMFLQHIFAGRLAGMVYRST